MVIVANKLDLFNDKNQILIIPTEVGKNYANSINAYFIEVSARTGEGIEELLYFYPTKSFIPWLIASWL